MGTQYSAGETSVNDFSAMRRNRRFTPRPNAISPLIVSNHYYHHHIYVKTHVNNLHYIHEKFFRGIYMKLIFFI